MEEALKLIGTKCGFVEKGFSGEKREREWMGCNSLVKLGYKVGINRTNSKFPGLGAYVSLAVSFHYSFCLFRN